MRKNLRKAYEFLERDGFAITLRVTERPDGVGAAVTRFSRYTRRARTRQT